MDHNGLRVIWEEAWHWLQKGDLPGILEDIWRGYIKDWVKFMLGALVIKLISMCRRHSQAGEQPVDIAVDIPQSGQPHVVEVDQPTAIVTINPNRVKRGKVSNPYQLSLLDLAVQDDDQKDKAA